MRKLIITLLVLIVGVGAVLPLHAETIISWRDVAKAELASLQDDDLARHSVDPLYLDGLTVSEARFSEAGFDWHLVRFSNSNKPLGPLWVIPHDDENAAFDSAITALKAHGGVAIVVNSGPGSSRMQPGKGTCGGRPAIVSRCDPNRNFSPTTPLFTAAHLDQRPAGQPIIALHTNSPGFGGGKGEITILDAASASRGKFRPRKNGFFGGDGPAVLKDHDSYAILPFVAPTIQDYDVRCRKSLVNVGVHVWHEPARKSDGSLSNYVVLEIADAVYVNMESRREPDLALASERHRLMIEAYLSGCRI